MPFIATTLSDLIRRAESLEDAIRRATEEHQPSAMSAFRGALTRPSELAIESLWNGVAKIAADRLVCAALDGSRDARVTAYGIVAAANNIGADIQIEGDMSNALTALHAAIDFSKVAGKEISQDIAEALGEL